MSPVPIIDLAPADSSLEGRRAVARAIDEACRNIGFFAITNHDVPAELVDDMWRITRDFFDAPADVKGAAAPPYIGYPYGYAGFANEALSLSLGNAAPPDLKESFSMGPLDRPDPMPADGAATFAYARTIWPAAPTDMPAVWAGYYRTMETLADRLMRLFALALDVDEAFFAPSIDRHISALRANHYPDEPTPPQPGQLRAGAHSDYGSLTILRQDAAPGGLQVRSADGHWLDVPYEPDSFVINIGDLMAQWTNDRWVSTLHRVVNPPRDHTGSTRRISVAFFHTPNWWAEIRCIPSCLPPGATPKYAPLLAGPHLMGKYHRSLEIEGQSVGDTLREHRRTSV